MRGIFALYVPAEGPIENAYLPRNDRGHHLEPLQQLVKGDVEHVPVFGRPDITLWINATGKYECLDDQGNVIRNARMTALLIAGHPKLGFDGANLMPGDFIAGDCVITGHDPQTGDALDCPADLKDGLLRIFAPVPTGAPPTV